MNPTQPQQSTSKVSLTTCQKIQRLLKFLAAKVPSREKAEVPATLAKEILMDKLQLCDQWDVVSICSHIYKEDR